MWYMTKDQNIALFNQKKIRRHWHATEEQWYFSIIDVVAILSENSRPRKYWNDLKSKLQNEGSEVSDKIGRLKLISADGKKRSTLVQNLLFSASSSYFHPKFFEQALNVCTLNTTHPR